jgi:hypothetical protein
LLIGVGWNVYSRLSLPDLVHEADVTTCSRKSLSFLAWKELEDPDDGPQQNLRVANSPGLLRQESLQRSSPDSSRRDVSVLSIRAAISRACLPTEIWLLWILK